jgi:hypothetical protein
VFFRDVTPTVPQDVTIHKTANIRLRLKYDGTRAGTRFCPSAKRTSPFKLTGASVQSTTGSRGVCISGSNAGYATFQGSAKSNGYPIHSPVFPSIPLPRVTVCHHISTGLYHSLPQKPQSMYVYILFIMIKYPFYIINSIISLTSVKF